MPNSELFYQMALSQVVGVGPIRFKKILDVIGNASEIFESKGKCLKKIEGTPKSLIEAIEDFKEFQKIEHEIAFAEKNGIEILSMYDSKYPQKLLQCVDSPPILFFKGNADLNHQRTISIIGTRLNSDYGKRICEELVEQLKPYGVIVSSGLAFGIDIIAHKACLKQEIPTVGVLANGLDKIYPYEHSNTAKEMTQCGGLLTEFYTKTIPNRENFPTRNRIVAGMSDATLVIETDVKGGSMITAELAFGYNREVFCVPGRLSDSKSAGCHLLIKNLKGQLVTSVKDMAASLGWDETKKAKKVQRELFIELNPFEQIIMDILKENESIHIDELVQKANLNPSQVAGAMLNLEMQSIVCVQPGKLVSLVN